MTLEEAHNTLRVKLAPFDEFSVRETWYGYNPTWNSCLRFTVYIAYAPRPMQSVISESNDMETAVESAVRQWKALHAKESMRDDWDEEKLLARDEARNGH